MAADRPRVRDILAGDDWMRTGAAGMSTAEIAKALAPLAGIPAGAFHATLEVADTLGKRLGFKSTKKDERTLALPYATAVRALVLALAGRRQAITTLLDTSGGAFIEAELPKDFRSLGGTLRFDIVEEAADRVRLAGVSEIRGQMFDWGKGRQALAEVFDQAELIATKLAA